MEGAPANVDSPLVENPAALVATTCTSYESPGVRRPLLPSSVVVSPPPDRRPPRFKGRPLTRVCVCFSTHPPLL